MAATHAGPIDIEQINSIFYVTGRADGFSTIQQAVDYVRLYNNATGLITVAQGVNVADDISAVTGGGVNILIWDNRAGNDQHWHWNGTNYVPQDFVQDSGFITKGSPAQIPASIIMAYDPNGGPNQNGAGSVTTVGNPGKGMPFYSIVLDPQDGITPLTAVLQSGLDSLGNLTTTLNESLIINSNAPQPSKAPTAGGLLITWNIQSGRGHTDFVNSNAGVGGGFSWFNVAPETTLNASSVPNMELNSNSDLILLGGITAVDANFNTCKVLGSPVRTAANFPYPATGIAVSTGSAWGTSVDPASLTPYPPSGIPQSTGSAWGTSKPAPTGAIVGTTDTQTLTNKTVNGVAPTTFAFIDPISSIQSQLNSKQASLTLTTTGSSGPATLVGATLNVPQYAGGGMIFPAAGIGVSTGSAWGTSLVAPTGALVGTTDAQTLTNKTVDGVTPATMAFVDPTSSIQTQLNGKATYPAAGIPNSTGSAWGASINPATLATYPAAGIAVSTGSAWGAAIATANVPLLNAASNVFTGTLRTGTGFSVTGLVTGQANTVAIQQTSSNAYIDSVGAAAGTRGTFNFRCIDSAGTGGAGPDLVLNQTGATFLGTITAAGKSFRIPHPLDETKDLVHSCIEGPEWGVYYRGEVVTANGTAEVTLPDYFEALTYAEDRSVLLTQIIESDDEPIALLAATRIIEGKFHIRAAGIAKRVMGVPETASVRVAWEVKAVRRIGVDRLAVVRDRFVHPTKEDA